MLSFQQAKEGEGIPVKEKTNRADTGAEMETLQLAAQMIMEHGGETYRAEETVQHMGRGFGLHQVESFAVPSGLFISYRTPEGKLETSVRRVHRKATDLTLVNEVNRISRETEAGKLDARQALVRLKAEQKRPRSGASLLLAAAICAGGFSFLFQGGPWDALLAACVALLVQGVALLLSRIPGPGIATQILGGMLTAMLPVLAARYFPGLNAEAAVAGALMPLVPGLAMTNAVQDTLRGDMVSGLSHGASALLTACLIAGGALLSSALLRLAAGGGLG